MQLFCFPHAGGTASFYDRLKPFLSMSIELTGMEYAGHGSRWEEAFYRDFGELAEDLYSRIRKMMCGCQKGRPAEPEPYALMGYSMGSVAAAEVLKRILSEREILPPVRVFLAAHGPFVKRELRGFRPDESDDAVRERTLRFGNIPERLARNRSFWRLYLPLYRADYSLIGRYDFDKLALRTDIPATIFYSEEDTPLAGMELWKRYFVGRCEFIRLKGGHFFMLRHSKEMADMISERLLRI